MSIEILSKDQFDIHTWNVVDSFFKVNKGYQLVKHQLESFNDFVLRKLDQIIDGFNNIDIYHQFIPEVNKFKYVLHIEIKNPVLSKPVIFEKDGSTKLMTPNDARQRNFTYSSALYVDVHVTTKTYQSPDENPNLTQDDPEYLIEKKSINNVLLGKIPIMVRSNYCILKAPQHTTIECKYDYGGYFIVNGNEKVIISQDRISENKTYVFVNNKISTYSHIAEIRSVQENKLGVPKITTLKLSSRANQFGRYIRVNIHHIKNDIPLFILFKALGLNSDKEVIKYIVHDMDENNFLNKLLINELTGCIEEANQVICPKAALEYLSKYLNITGYPKEVLNNKYQRINIIRNILEKEFLPHVGKEFQKKALYLGYMVNKLLKCFLGLKEFDDRDSYINKRVDTPGVLMSNLFRQYYGKVIKDMKNMIQKEINTGAWKATNKFINVVNKINITKIIKSTIIDSGMRYALATGNWGIKSNKNKQGVAQVLNRMTYSATLSHMRRINTPIEKSGKLVQPRKLHSTQWGIICPSECFDPNTPILLWNGIVKKAKDIVVGDYLIDDKGNATRVRTTCSGYKTMYDVIPQKTNFMTHTVTDNHILTLKIKKHKHTRTHRGKKEFMWFDKTALTYRYKEFNNIADLDNFKSSINDDDVIDITIEKYLSLPKNVQKNLYIFKSDGINWESKDVALDPYILGMWLGDGLSCGYGFATADKELLDKWIEWGKDNDATIKKGLKYKYHISSTINNTQTGIACNKTEKAPLKKLLAKYNLVNNKHIPLEYLVNDRKTRLALLAGLIDTDGNVRANGHEVRIPQGEDNYQIIYDAEFLARSLGFSCHVNNGMCSYTVNGEKRQRPFKELTITGKNLYEIPTVLPRKKLTKFDNPSLIKNCDSRLQSSFKLVEKDIQPFVGWQLEGNGRFLLGDMIVSHNTPEGASVGLVKNMAMTASITISSNSTSIREIVTSLGVLPFTPENIHLLYKHTKVIVNGDIIGTHENPFEFYSKLKFLKRKGCLNIYTGIVWHIRENEINICTEGGRCVRPLYIVQNNNIRLNSEISSMLKTGKLSWQDLVIGNSPDIDDSIIEFLDVEEVNMSMVAIKYPDLFKGAKGSLLPVKYTHLEIHPSLILGVLASLIPFSDHNQAPRNCYQCLDPNTPVLMANNTYKLIKDINIGEEVITFHPETKKTSITKVINQYVRPTDKKIVEITTISGRKIICTDYHPFMTNQGRKKVNEFDNDTKIGIAIYATAPVDDKVYQTYDIMTVESFKDILIKFNISENLINNHINKLVDLKLLPLHSDDVRLPVLARIVGFTMTDGSVSIYKNRNNITTQAGYNFGCYEDADEFENDIEFIGFGKQKITESIRELHGYTTHTYRVNHSADLGNLLLTLGVTPGKNTEVERRPVPDWIMNGTKNIKKEFLAGFQGGDGCQIRYNKRNSGYNFVCAETTQQINPKYQNSLEYFMKQMIQLFTEFNIDVNMTISNKIDDRMTIGYKIRDTQDNLINYFDTIGYRYDTRKLMNSGTVIEYLKYKNEITKSHIEIIEKVRDSYKHGETYQNISEKYNINIERVRDIIRSYKDGRKISSPHFKEANPDNFMNMIYSQSTSIFVPVKEIKELPNQLISDITTESENHSFIANHFLSFNSAQCKQAIGIYSLNYQDRYDTIGHILNYPQKPLIKTRMSTILNNDHMPNGINVIVAIATYTGLTMVKPLL